MKPVRLYFTLIFIGLITFLLSLAATNYSGFMLYILYGWFLGLILGLVVFWKPFAKWIGLLSIILFTSSCNFIPSDQIGVWVKNFGRSPEDYSIVMGKFPVDWTRSTWPLTFPGKPFTIDSEAFKVSSKDGVLFSVDPSVTAQLIRSDAACRKYAFKLSSYKDDVDSGLKEILQKEVLDAVRISINSAPGDSVVYNQTILSNLVQDKLVNILNSKYGIDVIQFSMGIYPPKELQTSINDRLLVEQDAKRTLASLAKEKAGFRT